jgi:hypothetical protein
MLVVRGVRRLVFPSYRKLGDSRRGQLEQRRILGAMDWDWG